MALGHPVVGRAVAVARVGQHVVEPDDPLAVERGGEDRGVARHREALERAPLDAGERVEHVRLAGVGDHVVEERAERRGRQLARGIGGELDDLLQLEPARDRASHALQRFRALLLEQQPAAGLLGLDPRRVLAVEQLERLDRVRRHLRQLDDDRLVVGGELAVLVPQLDQAEARAVARDQRRDEPGPGRRPVGPAAGDAVARADHVPRGVGDDLEDVVDGGGRRHRAGGIGERAQRVAHGRGIVVGGLIGARRLGTAPVFAERGSPREGVASSMDMSDIERSRGSRPTRKQREERAYRLVLATGTFGLIGALGIAAGDPRLRLGGPADPLADHRRDLLHAAAPDRPLARRRAASSAGNAGHEAERADDQRDDREAVAGVVVARSCAAAAVAAGVASPEASPPPWDAASVPAGSTTDTTAAGLSEPSAPIQRTTSPPA